VTRHPPKSAAIHPPVSAPAEAVDDLSAAPDAGVSGHGVVKRLTLLLIDDHAILREGLRALLELENDLEVIGEAGTFERALECATRLQPDVVLSDIGLPGR
jgi:two-component system response regulator DegU